jgi:hypothetical protein
MELVPILLITDAIGIYIPRNFATYFGEERSRYVSNITDEDWKILETGPDHEHYWDAWDGVCRDAVVKDLRGNKYLIYQDGDCWLIPIGMEWNDKTEQWIWPNE